MRHFIPNVARSDESLRGDYCTLRKHQHSRTLILSTFLLMLIMGDQPWSTNAEHQTKRKKQRQVIFIAWDQGQVNANQYSCVRFTAL